MNTAIIEAIDIKKAQPIKHVNEAPAPKKYWLFKKTRARWDAEAAAKAKAEAKAKAKAEATKVYMTYLAYYAAEMNDTTHEPDLFSCLGRSPYTVWDDTSRTSINPDTLMDETPRIYLGLDTKCVTPTLRKLTINGHCDSYRYRGKISKIRGLRKLTNTTFVKQACKDNARINVEGDKKLQDCFDWAKNPFRGLELRRRLAALPLSTQEPLYGQPAIQPETIHAVGNAGADGMPLGHVAAISIAIVLIGFTVFRSLKALLKRFRTPQKGKASTSGNDTGIT